MRLLRRRQCGALDGGSSVGGSIAAVGARRIPRGLTCQVVRVWGCCQPVPLPTCAGKSEGGFFAVPGEEGVRIIRQDWKMTDEDKKWHAFWSNRTGLEQFLVIASLGLMALVVLLSVLMILRFAPLETDWGTVADWAGAGVTFLGFAGAIAALRVQVKATDMQKVQHERVEKQVKTDASDKATKQVAEALEEKRRFASQVKFHGSAEHYGVPGQKNEAMDGKLVLTSSADFPANDVPFTDCRLIIPTDPRVKGFSTEVYRVSSAQLSGRASHNLAWKATGAGWFDGDDQKARAWFAQASGVEFRDPAGVRWRIQGDRSLVELSN